ncbi:hypothetical protein LU631_11315 [Erwinia tracheiphila]|uniref:Uncharacterized protein n=1 Tax=Erwinia tracheiphila TaxID=65700 RepID=A0A0M2K513_9GAMM|nr:hypothetical protein [Erwinia tracheiphila]AXF77484.1 hypothetical protein AV903_17835 [Erwinia tracheiphila]KKF34376.1 hypothetical protein SY86_23640 [Erwinia tracheiphila]KKF34465.1 hypothetical protein SY86_01710 [Erwinia tracheiphila]UIA86133.1 hypothetical protein LU631_13645 [Erwinia tracheiphila]UIA89601.1 hypothetical protein LU631_10800 [Erwinia tracheiphila]
MDDSFLFDDLLLAFWLLVFSWVFLTSAQAIIRDHCHHVNLKNKFKSGGMENEKLLRRTDK